MMKRCCYCGKVKPLSDFHIASNFRDGHRYDCKKCRVIRSEQYYETHKNQVEEYRQKNKEHIKEYNKIYHEINREDLLAYRQATKDQIKERMRKYRQTEQGKRLAIKRRHKYRAYLRSCKINDLTREEINFILEKAKSCAICKRRFTKLKKRTLDHIVPISEGGNNTLLNIQVVCRSCNSKKNTKHYTEFNGGQLLMFV